MTIINSLPHYFNTVVSTLAVMDKFSKTDVIQSLRNLESTRQTSSVLAANIPSSFQQKQSKPQFNPSKPRPICTFCKKLGHTEDKCFLKERVSPVNSKSKVVLKV